MATIAISLGLWYVAQHLAHLPPTLWLRFVDYHIDLGPFYPLLIYLKVATRRGEMSTEIVCSVTRPPARIGRVRKQTRTVALHITSSVRRRARGARTDAR